MNWKPITHNDQTDRPVRSSASEPLDFVLNDTDQAHAAAAARYHLRQHVERLNTLDITSRRKQTL